MDAILNIAVRAVRKAGRSIRGRANHVPPPSIGSRGADEFLRRLVASTFRSVATEVDRSFPEHKIIEPSANKRDATGDTVWIVETLNGWRNYQRQIDHHCTICGIRVDRMMKHALIVDHMRDEEYFVTAGEGTRNAHNRLRVSTANSIQGSLVALDDQDGQLGLLPNQLNAELRQSGCLGLDLAYLCGGRLDALIAAQTDWFHAEIARLFLVEAGGFASALNGGEWLSPADGLVAANPQMHRKIVTQLRNSDRLKIAP